MVRSSIIKQNKMKMKMEKRLRIKMKRRMAREGRPRGATLTLGPNGIAIGRPKKPPIIGSEKTDGKY
jgi:hypothetical protein